jgi:hypothetical protein
MPLASVQRFLFEQRLPFILKWPVYRVDNATVAGGDAVVPHCQNDGFGDYFVINLASTQVTRKITD